MQTQHPTQPQHRQISHWAAPTNPLAGVSDEQRVAHAMQAAAMRRGDVAGPPSCFSSFE